MPFGLWLAWAQGIVLGRVQIPYGKGQFWVKGVPIKRYRDFLLWAVEKRLNQSICRLGRGLACVKGSTSSIIFTRWRQCALMEGHISATWRMQLNCASAAAVWPYVKLLWSLVSSTVAIVVAAAGESGTVWSWIINCIVYMTHSQWIVMRICFFSECW